MGPEQALCDGVGWGDITPILGRTVGKSQREEAEAEWGRQEMEMARG